MQRPLPIPLSAAVELAKKARVEKDPWVVKRLLAIAATNDPELLLSFAERLRFKALIEDLDPMPFYMPTIEEIAGQNIPQNHILLGKVKGSSTPFLFNVMALAMHFLLLGRTGSGKTTLIYWLVTQCLKKGIPVWAFDRDKQDYRHLTRIFPEILVLQLSKDFKFNPLAPPPGVNPKQWYQTFVDTFCRTNALLDGSESLLLRLMDELYRKFGVFNGSGNFPCPVDLYEECRGLKFKPYSREAGFQSSILNRLDAYLTTNLDLYDCSVGFPLEELAAKSVVFELSGFSEKQAKFLLNIILYWLFNYRIANQQRGLGLRNIIVVDECKWLFPPFVNQNIGWPPITYMLAQLREFGVGIVAADQTANLDESIFVNSFLKICMSLGSGKDLEKVKTMFSLTREQVDYMHRLQVGEAVVRYPMVEKPFVIEIPEFPLR